jgi:IS5 family transposase
MWLELAKSDKNRKQRFLEEMDATLPWGTFIAICRKHYTESDNGRPKTDLHLLLKIYFLQQWYDLGDPTVKAEIYDSIAFRSFLGIDLVENVPDETVICRFRHFLEEHGLPQEFFRRTTKILEEKGHILKRGSIVDASIVSASPSTKNKAGKRDPEMSSTRKNNTFSFGMKSHIGVDIESGLVHTIATTTAKTHDKKMLESCLHGEERAVAGDKAYGSKEMKQRFRAEGRHYLITDRGARYVKLSHSQKKRNKKRSSVRAKVEHPFHVIKTLWGHTKVRYKGLYKNHCQWNTLAMLCNFYKLRHVYVPG